MTQRRIYYSTWSHKHNLDSYAIANEYDRDCERVAESIARKLGFTVVTLRSDGLNDGDEQFQTTLGTPVPASFGGGWSVETEIWFIIPAWNYSKDFSKKGLCKY